MIQVENGGIKCSRTSVYSEAGGVGKTTLSANLAVAHARAGLDVLAVPLDPQDGDMSYLFDADHDRADSDVDTLVHHLVGRGKGDFMDLVKTVEHGVDLIPEQIGSKTLERHFARNETPEVTSESRSRCGRNFSAYFVKPM
jgi:cellulose biosynthesis protein BcsQ